MNVIIRPYEPADLYSVMAVWNSVITEGDAFLEETPLGPEDMSAFLDQFRGVYCAVIGSEIAGVYLLRKLYPGKGSHVAEVIYAVKFSFRGLGIGKQMSQHSFRTAHDLGFASVAATRVPGSNSAAMSFLTKCGFAPAGEIPRGYRRERVVVEEPVPQPVEEPKKGLFGKIFEKNKPVEPAAPVEKLVVDYFSLYSYVKEV